MAKVLPVLVLCGYVEPIEFYASVSQFDWDQNRNHFRIVIFLWIDRLSSTGRLCIHKAIITMKMIMKLLFIEGRSFICVEINQKRSSIVLARTLCMCRHLLPLELCTLIILHFIFFSFHVFAFVKKSIQWWFRLCEFMTYVQHSQYKRINHRRKL